MTIVWRGTASITSNVADPCGAASGDYGAQNEFRRIVQMVQKGEREAIELAYFGGLTYKEVADRLGEPVYPRVRLLEWCTGR